MSVERNFKDLLNSGKGGLGMTAAYRDLLTTGLRAIQFVCNGCPNLAQVDAGKSVSLSLSCNAGLSPVEVTRATPLGQLPPCREIPFNP